ncbi:MAG: ATP-binding protein [Desulfobaccales bacterium]|nr:ATP-binding protein [Desulfobaccales bacterium]
MESGRARKTFSLATVIPITLAGTVLLSLLFFTFWQKLNQKVEHILREQFNQQQLMLAKKIADNVEAYIDFLENALLGYAGLFKTTPPNAPGLDTALAERFDRHKHFGVLELRRYNAAGILVQAFSSNATPTKTGVPVLPAHYQEWVKDLSHRGHLLLSKTYRSTDPSLQGRLVMRFFTPLYWAGTGNNFAGSLELVIDPFFIAGRVIKDVRSGQTGYAWIIDQDEIMLAHYEKDFVGHDAIQVRIERNPKIVFRGLRELHTQLLAGKEGVTEYDSGWHRQKLGQMPKLAAFAPIRFDKGLIRGVTDMEDPGHNLWGVCVVAPVEEVSGQVGEVMHQELFLVGLFFLMVLVAGGGLIGAALAWNKTLTREVEKKTRELLESQERLIHSERFAAVGEAAAYVSHEIKNPLMVIGGLAHQVERHLPDDPASLEKLKIIQEEVKRLETFLGDLRDFLRPLPPAKQKIDLNRVIKEVQTLMAEAAQEKEVYLEDRLDPRLPRIEADANQIKQVLVNLIKNALEATEDHGRILMATEFKDGQAWLTVQDTGRGMSGEVLEKIFHPFFTTKEKGTGLGLAVIHKIISDHHGTIMVESVAGRGSTFTIKLPQKG